MFSLNNELQCIEAAEPDVVSVHRSLTGLVIAPENHTKQMCDAFLCVIRDQLEGERVYAALYLSASKETLVYTSTGSFSATPVAERMREALSFLEAMGFQMEPCNLGGSTPLREVIIRTIKVLQPPDPNKKSPSRHPATPASPETIQSISDQIVTALQDSDESATESAAVRAERDWLIEEHAKTATVFATELAKLQGELERLRVENRVLADTTSLRIAALESDNAAADAELALLQDEYEALRNEYMLINGELTDRNSDLQELRGERASVPEPAAPGTESEQLSTALSYTHLAGPEDSPREHQADPGGTEARPFHLDSSLTAVPCGSPDEVVDLRVSFNTIRIICEGGKAQNCSAYICGLERHGSREIYVALYQTEDKRTQVYVPARQPSDAADYDRVLEDAITFADVTGFIINLAYLGGGAAERAKVLQQIPVLGCR